MKLTKGKKVGIGLGAFLVLASALGNTTPSEKQDLNRSSDIPTQATEISINPHSEVEKIETKTEVTTEVIPFESTSQNDSTLATGTQQVLTRGINGERTLTYEVSYRDGKETSRRVISTITTKEPINEVMKLGTKKATSRPQTNCDPNYTPCVPNVSYDLDCPDIGFSVTVIGNDKHGFDGNDNDGLGCESY